MTQDRKVSTRLAVVVGLARVDPAAYGGWDGECPGSDVDATRFGTFCYRAGFDGVAVLVDASATADNITEVFLEAIRWLKADDLLVFYNSGHGGQVRDLDGDEADRLDETLAWYDGEFSDDQFGRLLAAVPKGARVLHVTDTCHAGTNFRGRNGKKRPRLASTPMSLGSKATAKFRGSLVHFGGASDDRYSYGDDRGGQFTRALLHAVRHARKPISYGTWFARAAKRMPDYQRPVLAAHGGPPFVDRRALT